MQNQNQYQPQYNNMPNMNGQYPQNPNGKKKGNGCIIATVIIIAVSAFLCCIVSFFMFFLFGNDNSNKNEDVKETYLSNSYYDLIETYSYKTLFGKTHIVDKVLAKKSISLHGLATANDESGNIIGKADDTINLTKGKYNYFEYVFDAGCSTDNINKSAQVAADSILKGDENAVEVVSYNKSGNMLYIQFKQAKERLNILAKFKILFYKDDELVDTYYSYYSTSVNGLSGKGTEDVAEISVLGIDYDDLEIILED